MQTTPTRRRLLTGLAAGALALLATRALPAHAQEGGDTAFVQRLSDKLIGIINGPGSLAEKRNQIVPLLDQNVDVTGIGRFCLGRYWRLASPQQQQHFLDLFHRVLINSITDKLGQYAGVRVEVGSSEPRGAGSNAVNTTISRPGQPATNVQWVISSVGGARKVTDVYGEGVSLSITQRNDYTSYLQHNGNNVDALLKAMERQAAHQA